MLKNIFVFAIFLSLFYSVDLVLAQTDGSAPVSNNAEPVIDGSAPRATSEQTVAPAIKITSTPIPVLTRTLDDSQLNFSPQITLTVTPQIKPTQNTTPLITALPSKSILPAIGEKDSLNGNSSSSPFKAYGLMVAVAGAVVGGYFLLKSKTPNKGNKKNNNSCDKIKVQLDQKETELNLLLSGFSLKEIVLKELEKKLEDKKKEIIKDLENKAIDKVLEFDESGKIKKTVDLAREIKKQYDDLADKYNKAKKILELLKNKRGELEEEIKSLKSSYGKCMATRGVIHSVISQGGTSIETLGGNNKLYRYLADGEGVWSAGKRLLPPELAEEVNINRAWLKKPDLPEDNYRFWLTEAGKEKYEQTLYKIHQKYLSNIVIEEISKESLGKIIYEDKFQVVEKYDKSLS